MAVVAARPDRATLVVLAVAHTPRRGPVDVAVGTIECDVKVLGPVLPVVEGLTPRRPGRWTSASAARPNDGRTTDRRDSLPAVSKRRAMASRPGSTIANREAPKAPHAPDSSSSTHDDPADAVPYSGSLRASAGCHGGGLPAVILDSSGRLIPTVAVPGPLSKSSNQYRPVGSIEARQRTCIGDVPVMQRIDGGPARRRKGDGPVRQAQHDPVGVVLDVRDEPATPPHRAGGSVLGSLHRSQRADGNGSCAFRVLLRHPGGRSGGDLRSAEAHGVGDVGHDLGCHCRHRAVIRGIDSHRQGLPELSIKARCRRRVDDVEW